MGYIDEDWAKSFGTEVGSKVGFGLGVSLATGDPVSAITGMMGAFNSGVSLTSKANRDQDVIRGRINERIATLAFEANSRRGDLLATEKVEQGQFLTRATYTEFKNAVLAQEIKTRLIGLRRVVAACPRFREGSYFLAETLEKNGDSLGAKHLLEAAFNTASPVVQIDTVQGRAFELLCRCHLNLGEWEAADSAASLAIKRLPQSSLALAFRANARAALVRVVLRGSPFFRDQTRR